MASVNDSRIVVGIDGSFLSDAAVHWAAAEASLRGSRLDLVQVFVWPRLRLPPGCGELLADLRSLADNVVRESLEIARTTAPDVPVAGEKVTGYPLPVLLGESRTADLLVVGSGGLASTLGPAIGSISAELAAHAHCPVIVVRPQHSRPLIRRVVAGYDGSPSSEAALDFAVAHAIRHGLPVQVVAVRPPSSEERPLRLQDVRAVLNGWPAAACAEVLSCDGNPAEQLLRHSDGADLVVVGSRGRGGFEALSLGSVTQTVLRQATGPVAVIPAVTVSSHHRTAR